MYNNSKLVSIRLCRVGKPLSICWKSFGKGEFHHFSADWVQVGPECGNGCSTPRRSWKYALAVALSKQLWLERKELNCPIHLWVMAAGPACPIAVLRGEGTMKPWENSSLGPQRKRIARRHLELIKNSACLEFDNQKLLQRDIFCRSTKTVSS